jgi:transcriptional regulator with XRE-family HTH domain
MNAKSKAGKVNRKASQEILWRLSINLSRLRKSRAYTQAQLAKYCGYCTSYISNVERGTINITLSNLEALAYGLRCSADDLLREPL